MLELPMAPARHHQSPTLMFKKPDHFANLHETTLAEVPSIKPVPPNAPAKLRRARAGGFCRATRVPHAVGSKQQFGGCLQLFLSTIN